LALNNLGSLFVKREYQLPLFRRAAALGNNCAIFNYAHNLPDREPKKLRYLRKAVEHEYPSPDAMWSLGKMYESGRCGLEKNAVLAKEWKDKALAKGFDPAKELKEPVFD
jgi:TPR repeat protein